MNAHSNNTLAVTYVSITGFPKAVLTMQDRAEKSELFIHVSTLQDTIDISISESVSIPFVPYVSYLVLHSLFDVSAIWLGS